MTDKRLILVVDVLRALSRNPAIPADPDMRLDMVPLLDSILLVQAVADIEHHLGQDVDFALMEAIQTIGDLAACFPTPL